MKRVLEQLTLQTPASRVGVFGIVTAFLYAIPYGWLERAHLSLYERLHIPSPSIGLTRAYWRLIRLDFIGAWHRNKLIYLVVAIGLPLIIRDIIHLTRKHL